jgi:penicillin-binding protein 2
MIRRRKRIPYDPPYARAGKGKGKSKSWRRSTVAGAEQALMSRRMLFAKGAVVAAFTALAARLGFLQIAESEKHALAADDNKHRPEVLRATRGLIFDRQGRELAVNRQTWEVRVLPQELPPRGPERTRVLDHLINALDIPDALVLDPLQVPKGAEQAVYTRTAQLLGKVLTVEPTEQTVQYPFFRVPGQIVRVNGADLLLFVYPDVTSRKSDSARISSDGQLVAGQPVAWPSPPQFSTSGNVLAVLLSGDERLGGRVERAISTLGQTAPEGAIEALRTDALQAWTDYIAAEAELNWLVRLEDDLSTDLAALCRAHLNELPGVRVMNRLEYLVENGRFNKRVPVVTGVPRDVALKLEANRLQLPGVELDGGVVIRRYLGGESVSHVLGYVGKISQRDLASAEARDELGNVIYQPDDYIGKDGIELQFERVLRGQHGKQVVELTPNGTALRALEDTVVEPVSGRNVALTIDLEFQRAVAEILREGIRYSNEDRQALAAADPTRTVKKLSGAGSVVALDPRTGEVLAMVSLPLYDNQLFVDGISQRKYEEYISDAANKPLIDRSLRGMYPPGSTLKPFLAAAGLEEEKVTPEKTFSCTGSIRVPYAWDRSKGNSHPCWIWRAGGHEALDVFGAIEQSCDVYFYNLGAPRQPLDESRTDFLHYRDEFLLEEGRLGDQHYFEGMGIQAIKAGLMSRFLFGAPTGIELPTEAPGVVPDPEWRARTRPGSGWSVGDTIITSIGQGDFLATPLQMALNTAALGAKGAVMRPMVVREIFDDDRISVEPREPAIFRQIGIQPRWIEIVREGMRRVVHGEMGTARRNADGSSKWTLTNPAGEPEILVGGKTGTAEIGEQDENGRYDRQHSWFACFAPYDEPEIAISVLVEDGGEGSAYAVPVADRVLRAWFEINGRRPKGLVLRPDANLADTDDTILAPNAAFPIPGAFAAAGIQDQD